MIEIRNPKNERELSDLYRFRYKVYVEEMSRKQAHACHEKKIIVDPLDENGLNIVAIKNNKIVGAVRINYAKNNDMEYYEKFYNLSRFKPYYPDFTSICTRLMVKPQVRNTYIMIKLFYALYSEALGKGIRFNIIDCNDPVVNIFYKFGYRLLERKTHHEYGDVNIMYLDLLDFEFLKQSASPFLRIIAANQSKFDLLKSSFSSIPVPILA